MFADDIALIGENRREIYNWLNEWRLAPGEKKLRISISNTEYMKYEFGGREHLFVGMSRVMAIKTDMIGKVGIRKFQVFKSYILNTILFFMSI